MCHAGNLDKPGKMTLSDFIILLDYIKTLWDNGSLEVLTPSGLFFADPNSNSRLELTANDSFDGVGTWNGITKYGKTIQSSGGKTGNNFLRIDRNITNSPVNQKINTSDKSRVSGEQFVFEGWIRAYGIGTTTGVVQINKVITTGSSWTKVRFVFCVPPNVKTISLSLCRSAGVGIDWDDVSIKKI
jgi:hypothetical protein